MEQDSENNGKITGKDPETGRFLPGNTLGKGKPVGSRDFATDFDEVVEEIAEENGITKSQARKHLLKVAYKNAKEGNYSFYKDIHDRVYGQATQKTEVKGELNMTTLSAEDKARLDKLLQ
jgi:hypothetical protein